LKIKNDVIILYGKVHKSYVCWANIMLRCYAFISVAAYQNISD